MTIEEDPVRSDAASPDAIAFVSSDPQQFGSLSRLLRRSVGDVALADSIRGIENYASFALVAVHYDSLSPEQQAELAKEFSGASIRRPTLLLLSERGAQRDLARLFGTRALTNMLMIDQTGVDVSDLLVTVQKIRRGDIFGLEKYFGWGVETRVLKLSTSTQKNDALNTIAEYAASIGVAPRLRGSIRTVADEFVTNAIYNAPVTASGARRFSKFSRTVPVTLDPGEEIEIRYCCDGRRFGLSATDPFGSLPMARVQDYLAKGLQGGPGQMGSESGGAGIGLYEILDSLTHFVINLAPGKKTEMIGLVDVSAGYRAFAESGKSFNIFAQGGQR